MANSYQNWHFKVDRAGYELDRRLCCMWTLPACARRVIHARSLLAPESWLEYPARTSLVSPLHTGVVSHHARSTLRQKTSKYVNLHQILPGTTTASYNVYMYNPANDTSASFKPNDSKLIKQSHKEATDVSFDQLSSNVEFPFSSKRLPGIMQQ